MLLNKFMTRLWRYFIIVVSQTYVSCGIGVCVGRGGLKLCENCTYRNN